MTGRRSSPGLGGQGRVRHPERTYGGPRGGRGPRAELESGFSPRSSASVMPLRLGYKLSCEEHRPNDLVRQARMAESVGFSFALVSDHFHPWTDEEGQSPFVWSVIGAVAQATGDLVLGTGVTCPTTRIHPAIVAQAAATSAAMMPGRFFLGVGAGENLNEHIVGKGWPEGKIRQDRLAEAIEVIRLLWRGGKQSHHGRYYTVEGARLYTLPESTPPLYVAAAGPRGATIAAKLGDGLVGTTPDAEMMRAFDEAGGSNKPRYGEITVCFGADEETAVKTAHRVWGWSVLPGAIMTELPLPSQFEAASKIVTEEQVANAYACGPDPERHLKVIRKYQAAGYSHLCVHQIGPDQEGFLRFYAKEILPRVA